jgi:protein O-mannosyl-transferase
MLNKINISPGGIKIALCIVLAFVTLAVYWQVNHYDFINVDDPVYVTSNDHVRSGITPDGILWALRTIHAQFWHPLTWISWMLDYQLYGLNAGGYHITNVILHILSALLLFALFCRMTGSIWPSAFAAAFFALHPLRVESVAFISERKDVLSVFFWMLTLYLYTCYTEKPVARRYLPVLLSFTCALMSKPMVVTLPLIMILLDYWPLGRFQSRTGNLISWQLREKAPFFILSVVFSIMAIYTQYAPYGTSAEQLNQYFPPLGSRIANALISCVNYLEKIFWPDDLAAFYSFAGQSPVWQVLGAALIILVISVAVAAKAKRLPHLFAGWLWYVITLAPVIGIIPIINFSTRSMADHYTYLPSIGIGIMLAWGIPLLFPGENIRKRILFPVGVAILAVLAVLTWRQCHYWENSITLLNRTLQVTKNNDLAYTIRGNAYYESGRYLPAIDDFTRAVQIQPYNVKAYNNRGTCYVKLGLYQQAVDDYNKAIDMKYVTAYIGRGTAYLLQGNKPAGCSDAQKACTLGECKLLEDAKLRGYCH